MKIARVIIVVLMLVSVDVACAQRFFNLSADEVKIDSVMPSVCYTMSVASDYQDSIYTATLLYPEFIDMTQQDIDNYKRYCNEPLPSIPVVNQDVIVSDKIPYLQFFFSPLVYRDGRYQILVSYALDIKSQPKPVSARARRKASDTSVSYADNSVLASGQWAKIRVPSTGFYELTDAVIRQAGFTNLDKVHIYGYGGNLVPEKLTPEYLTSTDDLKPVETATVDGSRVFYAKGPVSWSGLNVTERVRNPYSDYGYYFITQQDDSQTDVSSDELMEEYLDSPDRHYSIYEVDNYAYIKGGRNLVDGTSISAGKQRSVTIAAPDNSLYSQGGTLTVVVASDVASKFTVSLNGTEVGDGKITLKDYDKAGFKNVQFTIPAFEASNTVTVTCTEGGPICLDYAMLYVENVEDDVDLESFSIPAAEYYCNITNQNHHADSNVDMTIIISTSQKLLDQAQRLKQHHEDFDGISVRIVPADELYNEFSSGTPDVSAYRRYMKMMYDRAGDSDSVKPKSLLLFGDCLFDNRLLTAGCRSYNADDLLLCYESENSYNEIYCFVSDDFIGMLDDNEVIYSGSLYDGTPDIGVGRFPVYTEADAKTMVDKVIKYANNSNAGSWENTIMFMGDDGNNNMHMTDVNDVADNVISTFPGYYVRKVMWDAYTRTTSSTGNRYPDVENIIKSQQNNGALVMDYAGHGTANAMSHEYVLRLTDFQNFSNTNLPLWITASCDLMPFDGLDPTIGEAAVINSNGGAVAFYGTTRTVYANYNKYINAAFIKNILTVSDGKALTLGEANKQAKTQLVLNKTDRTVNKLQYSLLGDPALRLNVPLSTCVVDSINGIAADDGVTQMPAIRANSIVTVKGHIDTGGEKNKTFNGLVTMLVRDNLQEQKCLGNESGVTPFTFNDRPTVIFSGTDSVSNGEFNISFAVSRDISYSDETGLITLFAHNTDCTITAHGENSKFTVGGTETVFNDSIGPSIYCYLNSPSFVNGGDVNTSPYFVAQIADDNGINATGAGIGHDLQLVIDNSAAMTYNLNDNFQFDFGTYTSGSTYYNIPTLEAGIHTLRFRAWDILNNPSTTTLSFNVVSALTPNIVDVNVTNNPAKTTTTFIVSHDRAGSDLNIDIEIFDMSGRLLHEISKSLTASSATSTIDWNLTLDNGAKLQTGVYLYRVCLSSDGSSKSSKAKKLIII